MSDFENPYQSPESPIVPETRQNTGNPLSENMLQHLFEASPWLRFVGILGYIGSGLIAAAGIIFAISSFAASAIGGLFDQFPLWLLALAYIPLGAIFFFPSHFTYNFGKKIRNYRFSNSSEDLETAFKNNKSLWKFYGILCIINLSFIPVSIVIALIAGIAAVLNV